MKKMKPENRKFAIEMAAIMLVLLVVIGLGIDNQHECPADNGVDESIGEPLYRITYYKVGGTDEHPIVQSVIENLSDQPLTITFPDTYDWYAPESETVPNYPFDGILEGEPDEA